jgi:hypothetical protein
MESDDGPEMLILALPSVLSIVVVLVGSLLNNSDLRDLRAHMDGRFDEMRDILDA